MAFLKGLSILCFIFVSVNGFQLHKSRTKFISLYGSEENYEDGAAKSKRRLRPTRIRPLRPSNKETKSPIEKRQNDAKARHKEALKDPTLLTKLKFADRADIHPAVKRAITELFGLQSMTQIQAKTYEKALYGESILGKSKTGTGKTLAFLLPVVERLLELDLDLYKPGRDIGVIIIAPTRELAIQISEQAKILTSYINDFDVACIYGGTKMQRDMRLFSGPRMPSILVATPGRILEHLDNTRINRRKFSDIAEDTKIVVLDEADRLFESFPRETRKILAFLPRAEKRQTLLFSATISNKLRHFLKATMRIQYTEVDCVNSRVGPETNLRAQQVFLQLKTMEEYISKLVGIIQHEIANDKNCKIIVFCKLIVI
jgi:ATP-dependent RNA helicase MSS116